ncbi:MAG TPA: thioredoxin family protein [Kofleriaceae bacterium]|jgi:thioredoxin-like negative regulator of GroEL|nr:thioredoxin family protein [Kofleriaceae bacterium]
MKRLLAIAILLAACDKKPASQTDHATPGSPATASGDPARSPAEHGAQEAVAGDPCAKAHIEGSEVMPWISDDLASALACAKLRKVPVVIDEWAPWCHTCLSMQSTVFTDPSFKPDVDRFVFVALDTDKEVNADAVAKYPPSAWPTFYVIGEEQRGVGTPRASPAGQGNSPEGSTGGRSDIVLARFVGAASLAQFHAFLDAGQKAQQGGAAGADAHLLGAERAIAMKDLATAEQELAQALAQAPGDWARRPDALTSLISTKRRRNDIAGCLDVAEKSMGDTGNAAAATDFIVSALACTEAYKDERKDDAASAGRIKKLRERAATRLDKLVADASAPLSVDDRSDALATLREVLDALGRSAEAKATAEKQRALLDDAAAKARTPMAAMTYNWQRCEVYTYLGKPLEMVPALEKSARDLPDQYDPRARLGWIYLQAGRLPEAAQWTDEALRMVYGPRKARVLGQRAEIAEKQHDAAGEKLFRQETVKLWESLPPGQANPDALAKAKKAVAALEAPTASRIGAAGK